MLGWQRNTTEEILGSLNDGGLRFSLVSLELWARMFFGGESADDLGEKLAGLVREKSKRATGGPSLVQSSEPRSED